ncbi:MAG TPA: ABC transporter ATP-binding protein [Kiritimatiellia bacterium]|nr:ABC transporter ATP-binding protein [Kiritimatiellia bacterium]
MSNAQKEPLLRVENLSVSFKTDDGIVRAVDRVSFDVMRGEILGIVGESGCGKSVTAMSLLRLIPRPPGSIDSGKAWFGGRDLLSMPIEELRGIRGRDISMIFQEPMTALSPLHRIGRQMVETQQFHRDVDTATAWNIGVEWLKKVGIPDAAERMYAYPYELSGGMRQRVMIAMALMLEPKLIIADEPTTALDVTIQAQILALLREMKSRDTAVMLITHNLGVVWEMCSRMMVMYASEIVETGGVDELFANPAHPYTEALLKANPALAERRGKLETIPGQVPSPVNYPQGCRFQDRCPLVSEACRQQHPAIEIYSDRGVRCLLAESRIAKPGGAS